MFGILVAIAVYAFLGFLLAWISQVIAKEDISVGTGVVILILTGIVGFGIKMFAISALGDVLGGLVALAGQFGVLIVMLNVLAHLTWKHSAIIASIYTGVLFAIGLAMRLAIG